MRLSPRRQVALASILLAAGACVFWRYTPGPAAPYPPCPVHAWTGLHCPGCGSARALHAIVHGNFLAALRYNAFATLFVVALTPWATWQGWHGLRHDRFASPRFRTHPRRALLGWVALWVILAFTVARNLPWLPFSWLAPRG